jgi:hypothetical protein
MGFVPRHSFVSAKLANLNLFFMARPPKKKIITNHLAHPTVKKAFGFQPFPIGSKTKDMPNLWQRLFKLEQEVTQSSPARPAIHELIERSPAELADYEQWKSSFILRRLLDWLADQYAIYLHDPQAIDGHTDFLNTPSSQGFILHFHDTNYTRREATFLFDYLKERVLTLNYRTQISDTMTYTRPRWVETSNPGWPSWRGKSRTNSTGIL